MSESYFFVDIWGVRRSLKYRDAVADGEFTGKPFIYFIKGPGWVAHHDMNTAPCHKAIAFAISKSGNSGVARG